MSFWKFLRENIKYTVIYITGIFIPSKIVYSLDKLPSIISRHLELVFIMVHEKAYSQVAQERATVGDARNLGICGLRWEIG